MVIAEARARAALLSPSAVSTDSAGGSGSYGGGAGLYSQGQSPTSFRVQRCIGNQVRSIVTTDS